MNIKMNINFNVHYNAVMPKFTDKKCNIGHLLLVISCNMLIIFSHFSMHLTFNAWEIESEKQFLANDFYSAVNETTEWLE